jgi:hypothetical protein
MPELTEAQAEWLANARTMLAFLEAHPSLIGPLSHPLHYGLWPVSAESFAAVVAEMGDACEIGKSLVMSNHDYTDARLSFGAHQVVATIATHRIASESRTVVKTVTEPIPLTYAALVAMHETAVASAALADELAAVPLVEA